jgi:two-component system, NarL family, nitrate/nitrite response regulator NarL
MSNAVAAGSAHGRAGLEVVVTVVTGLFEPLLGYGLQFVLGSDPRVCVLASGLGQAELEDVVARQAPLVAIVDESVEQALLERLGRGELATGVAVIAHEPTDAYGLRRLARGVSCIARSASRANVLAAVHLIGDGGRVFVAVDGQRIERSYPSGAPVLTGRETEVLRYLSQDKRYAEIASALEISPETVRTHAVSIRRKLNVQSRRELVGMPVLTQPG